MKSADTPMQNGSAYTQQAHEADVSQPGGGIDEKMAGINLEAADGDGTEELALDMQRRCQKLLEELGQFQAHLRELKKETRVEVKGFKGGLHAESKSLNKLAKADPNQPKTKHGLRSSNLLFYSSVWATAKTCTSVIGLCKKFYWPPSKDTQSTNGTSEISDATRKQNHALVDVVTQDGLEWIKVSSITEKRIIWDLAKAGWVDSDDESDSGLGFMDDDEPEGLLKQVEALIKASRATVVRNRHPKIVLILPRISSTPESKEVGNIIAKIRDLGVVVQTSDEIPSPPPLAEAILKMAAERFNTFSETLSIDCTILLAFASDLSHGRVEPEDWHNKAISRQIEMEAEDQLLPNSLWPACGSKKMVCTRHAAVRMQEIVETIGTENERKRADLLLNSDPSLSHSDLLAEFQTLTDYPVPPHWALPIQVVDVDIPTIISSLPSVAEKVAENLTPINQSVFLYGWAKGLTTLSSNGSVAKGMEFVVDQANKGDAEVLGPDVWLSQSSRSLVGKEKQRRGYSEKESGGFAGGDGESR